MNLERLSEAASRRPFFLGYLIEKYLQMAGVERATLLHELKCDEDTFQRLRLCKVPSAAGDRFAHEARLIADKYRIDLGALVQMLRDTAVSDLMARESCGADAGWLMAARDRDDSDDSE